MRSCKKYSVEDIKFLRDNYPYEGVRFCALALGRSEASVEQRAQKLKIRVLTNKNSFFPRPWSSIIDPNKLGVNPELFYKPILPEVCYAMGLVWADGYVGRRKKATGNSGYNVTISNITTDSNHFHRVLSTFGKWNVHHTKKAKGNRQLMSIISISNKPIFELLHELGYAPNTKLSLNKVISHIPSDSFRFFLMGLIDGDGCYVVSKKRYMHCVQIAAGITHDWTALKNLLGYMGIHSYISKSHRLITKKSGEVVPGGGTYIRIQGIKNLKALFSYLFRSEKDTLLVLPRKLEKIKQMGLLPTWEDTLV